MSDESMKGSGGAELGGGWPAWPPLQGFDQRGTAGGGDTPHEEGPAPGVEAERGTSFVGGSMDISPSSFSPPPTSPPPFPPQGPQALFPRKRNYLPLVMGLSVFLVICVAITVTLLLVLGKENKGKETATSEKGKSKVEFLRQEEGGYSSYLGEEADEVMRELCHLNQKAIHILIEDFYYNNGRYPYSLEEIGSYYEDFAATLVDPEDFVGGLRCPDGPEYILDTSRGYARLICPLHGEASP